MELAVQELFSAGLAASTKRVYQTGTDHYLRFCASLSLSPYPTSKQVLALFVAHLYQEGLCSSTVKSYLSAVRHSQIALGLGDPQVANMPQLAYVTRGLWKLTVKGDRNQRLPFTPHILRQLHAVWECYPNWYDATMLWAACCMCFFGFLRSGEIVVPSDSDYDPTVHLSLGDVRVDNTSSPSYLEIYIKASKTDPFWQGVRVYLGKSNTDICPVASVLAYMVVRGPRQGPFFVFADGHGLTRDRLVTALRSALHSAGIPEHNYAGHSFRVGAATTAAQNGVPESIIKTMGCWESAAYMLYIRTPQETHCAVAQSLMK